MERKRAFMEACEGPVSHGLVPAMDSSGPLARRYTQVGEVLHCGCASSQRAARSAGLCGCCWCLKPGGGGGAEWLAHTRVIAYEQAQPVLHAHVLLCRVASHSSALQVEVTGPLVRGEQHK